MMRKQRRLTMVGGSLAVLAVAAAGIGPVHPAVE
jgi:hypothetical protein